MMMKRIILLIAIAFNVSLSDHAQIPDPGDPVCVFCYVNLKTGEAHKPGCRYYSAPTNEESTSSISSSSSSTVSKPSRPFNERTDVNPDEYGRGSYSCPECGKLYHTGSCKLGKVQSEYRKLHDEIRFSDKKWKKKAYREALDRREQLWSELKRCINDAWWKKDHPSYSSGSSSYSDNLSSSSVEQIKLSYECNICKASVKAYNINDAIKEFADNPWIHNPTCPNYKPEPGQSNNTTSTKLKDYTPASERPMVSEPLMDMPLLQPAPLFSSINESNIRYATPTSLTGKHDWGEIDESATLAYFRKINNGRPISFNDLEYDIERYNHEGGPVVIGIHQPNGRYIWFVFFRQSNGKYAPIDDGINRQTALLDDGHGRDVNAQTIDVRYEGQGKFVIREYEGGEKFIYNTSGTIITTGRKVSLLNSTIDGKQMVFSEPEEDGGTYRIIDENAHTVASGNYIETYDDAIVQMNVINGNKRYSLSNWHGKELRIDGFKFFDEIKAYNNNGSYYLLKDNEKGYTIVGRGFKRVGGWYDTEEEAHRIWGNYHP